MIESSVWFDEVAVIIGKGKKLNIEKLGVFFHLETEHGGSSYSYEHDCT